MCRLTAMSRSLGLRMVWYSCGGIRLPAEPGPACTEPTGWKRQWPSWSSSRSYCTTSSAPYHTPSTHHMPAWSWIAAISWRQTGNSVVSMVFSANWQGGAILPAPCRRVPCGSESRQEAADRAAVVVDVDEERVVALRRVERHEFHRGAGGFEAFGDLLLLLQREQDVGADADHQRALEADALEAFQHAAAAVFGDVEPVAGAREVEVA